MQVSVFNWFALQRSIDNIAAPDLSAEAIKVAAKGKLLDANLSGILLFIIN